MIDNAWALGMLIEDPPRPPPLFLMVRRRVAPSRTMRPYRTTDTASSFETPLRGSSG
jgi:hypothetical protein